MPVKETSHQIPILIDDKFFIKLKKASNKKEFHASLRSLITRANNIYNNVFKSVRLKHFEYFPLCKQNYIKIQSYIKNQAFSKTLFNVYYLEAELACIQSDFNALNYSLKSKKELTLLKESLIKILSAFEKFNKDFNHLNFIEKSSSETSAAYENLLGYRDTFSKSWDENSNRLLGDAHYNFAKFLEKTCLENSLKYYEFSADFYQQAANSAYPDNRDKLLKFEIQTRKKIKKIEATLRESPDSSPNENLIGNLPKLTVVLSTLSLSSKTNKIKTESILTASYKEEPSKLSEIADQPILQLENRSIAGPCKIQQAQTCKRKSLDTTFFTQTKKKKSEANKRIDCKKLLDELKQIEIENYKLKDPSNKNELIRYKASLAGKDALDRIEKLSFSIKNLSETEKLYCLKEVQNSFSHSIKFYSQAELVKESERIIQYYDILTLFIDSLELKVSANKPSTEKLTLSSNKNLSKKFNNEHSHQPARYTRTFFRELSCPENDVIPIVDNQSNLNNPTLLF